MSTKLIKISIAMLFVFGLAIPSSAKTAPSEAGAIPFPEAPLCPTHENTAYHGLWDSVRGCHYDHTHNDDPAVGDSVFGPAGASWGGQTISYPWMTANENSGLGHGGYKYYVNLNPQPTCAFEGYEYLNPQNCISAFRIQYHDAGGNAHMVKRFHSYYMEVQIKRGNITGYIRTGGWADFGCLHEVYKEKFLPLPGIDPVNSSGQSICGSGHSIHSDPYRAPMRTLADTQGLVTADNPWIWTSHNKFGYNKLGFFFFRTLDSWGGLDPADPYAEHFICPDFRCKYNNTEHNVFNVFAMPPSSLDTDKDGIVNYTGYTDKAGNIIQGCTAPSLECVPLQIVNAPVGNAIWSRNLSGPRPSGDPIRDHDIYFNGKPSGWIQFQNHVDHSPTSTPIITPSSTPPLSSNPLVSTKIEPTNLSVGGTALVSVNLNNIPAEGYKSAEFTCTYNAGLVEKSNIVATSVFGSEPVVAVHDPQNGTFIVAVAGTNGNKATTSGAAFTFSVKGLQVGQSQIQCTARVSKGDNMPLDIPSTGASLTVFGVDPSLTPFATQTSTPSDHQHSTATATPFESPTPLPPTDGALAGQVIASKPVTVSLYDANNVVVKSVVANPDGTFILTAPAGTYIVVAAANGFIGHQGSVTLIAGNTNVRTVISLIAGDIDGNNVIDQFDALTIGMSYNTAIPPAADLNNDGVIDFLDLEILAENYRKSGPLVWE